MRFSVTCDCKNDINIFEILFLLGSIFYSVKFLIPCSDDLLHRLPKSPSCPIINHGSQHLTAHAFVFLSGSNKLRNPPVEAVAFAYAHNSSLRSDCPSIFAAAFLQNMQSWDYSCRAIPKYAPIADSLTTSSVEGGARTCFISFADDNTVVTLSCLVWSYMSLEICHMKYRHSSNHECDTRNWQAYCVFWLLAGVCGLT